MAKASDIVLGKNTSFLFKGVWGFGKTLAAASFALDGPLHISYFDKQKPVELQWFRQFGEVGRKILDNIEYDVYGSHNVHEYLNKYIKLANDNRYTTLVTDSVTNLTSASVNWSLGFRDPKGPQKDKVHKDASKILPDWDEYKIETSIASQVLDICRSLSANIIWIAHPLPQTRVEGAGASMKVTKGTSIVTYGSKVAGLIPGSFTEIYHFAKTMSYSELGSSERYNVLIRAIGDDYAKTSLFNKNTKEIDITDKIFYTEWKEALRKQEETVQEETPTSLETTTSSSSFPPKWKV